MDNCLSTLLLSLSLQYCTDTLISHLRQMDIEKSHVKAHFSSYQDHRQTIHALCCHGCHDWRPASGVSANLHLELRSVPATTTPHAIVDDELAEDDLIQAAGLTGPVSRKVGGQRFSTRRSVDFRIDSSESAQIFIAASNHPRYFLIERTHPLIT
jgi:hypothetical protein